jgi:RNA polymerase sigma-70 factor (ECF subfamily)
MRMEMPNPNPAAAASHHAETPAAGSGGAPASPEDLLAAWIEGSEEAFEALVEQVGGRLYGFVRRMMGSHHRAEDVYQTVLLKMATKARMYQRRASLNSWLFQIARNACLDELRRENRNPSVSLDVTPASQEGPALKARLAKEGPEPDAAATQAELGRAIAEAVESLPDEQREVFLLREDGELNFEEIGSILGCGKETAKSRMRYALERLRNALGREARIYGLS